MFWIVKRRDGTSEWGEGKQNAYGTLQTNTMFLETDQIVSGGKTSVSNLRYKNEFIA